jgi:nucleotide-binding universal stress UspA family protein
MDGIVVGVDRSAAAGAALDWALAEGARRGRRVTVVHAWSDAVSAGYPLTSLRATDPEVLERQALHLAQELLKAATARVLGCDQIETSSVALRGAAAAVLAEASDGADLVVVGTQAACAFTRAVLGSVTSGVLHAARCPVAVVPEPRLPGARGAQVVVGVDHSPASAAALAWAAAHAAQKRLVLVPVFVREPVWSGDSGELSVPELEQHERAALADAVPAGLRVVVQPEVVCGGHPRDGLLEAVQPQDVLVVGSRGRGAVAGRLLGSTSAAVVRSAPCPVVVVRGTRA